MNAPIILAQLSGSQQTNNPNPPRNLKIEKPQNNQAVSIRLDGATKLDFSDIASEKLTFVRIGDRLIVLFDNQSTVTIDPMFDAGGNPLPNVTFEVGPDRIVDGTAFANLFPITTDQSVLPAAGAAAGGPSAGANFSNPNAGSLGGSGARLALLGNEETGGPGFGNVDPGNPQPIFNAIAIGNVDDEGLSEGNIGGPGDEPGNATSITNSLNVDFGTDFEGRQFAFTATQAGLTGLTSGGEAVNILITTINGQPAIIGFVGSDSSIAANQVFTITLDAGPINGAYTFTLLRPLDHPIADTEDTLTLTVGFTATDGSGDTGTSSFGVAINDDSPEITLGEIQNSTVNEDVLPGRGEGEPNGNPEQGEGEGGPTQQISATGSLGIRFGADRFDTNDTSSEGETRQDGAVAGSANSADLIDNGRSVYFTNTTVLANGAATALTSHGETLSFRLDESGTKLIGFVPGTQGEGSEQPSTPDRIVFTVSLSDDGNGTYAFTLFDELDHPIPNADDDLDLQFNFTARDSDTDTIGGNFTVTVNDDTPIFGGEQQQSGRVHEDTLPTGNPGDTYTPSEETERNTFTGVLGVKWGADNSDTPDFSGPQDGAVSGSSNNAQLTGRALYFTDTNVTASFEGTLTSNGQTVLFKLDNSGTKLIGYIAGESESGEDDTTIFEVTLSDDGEGSYTFTLFGPLDHPGENTEDDVTLNFNVTARDYDGDTATSGFSVTVNDDAPIQTEAKPELATLDEDDLANFNPLYPLIADFWQGSLGSSPFDGSGTDNSNTGLLGTVSAWGDLGKFISPGADGPGSFHLVSEAQAETLLATIGPNAGDEGPGTPLKSHGDLINDARFINIPGVGEALGFFASDGRLVFGLFVSDDGTYNVRLFDQIDHPQGDANPSDGTPIAIEDILNLDLSGFVQYTDFDGDTITLEPGTFSVDVKDDIPYAIGAETGLANENDLANFNPLYPVVFDFLQGSLGTSPFDGFTDDGSVTGLLGTVPVYGFLGDNVTGGADEFGRFDLVSDIVAAGLLEEMGLVSHGDAIDHTQSINIPGLGEAMGFFASDGRLVFGLFMSEAGFYNFRLFDQLDHAPNELGANGAPTAIADSLTIDLSKFVTYTDFDGDTIDLSTITFAMTIVDDIPVLTGQSVNVSLDEDDLNNFLPGWDLIPAAIKAAFPIEGSAGTSPDSDTDALLLNSTGKQGFLNEIIGTNVVNGGADEFGQFGLVTVARADYLLTHDLAGWTSKGEPIDHVQTLDLGLLGDVMGFFAGDRLVFTVTINPTGFYDIRLWDQVDHLGTGNGDQINLDLSKFVTYTDFDGDSIDLGTGHLVLTVVDDSSEAVLNTVVYGTVEDEQIDLVNALQGGDLTHGNDDGNSESGDDLDTPANLNLLTSSVTIGSIASLVNVGADENGTFSVANAIEGTQAVDVNGNAIKSRGVLVKFHFVNGTQLIGFADTNDDGIFNGSERTVFKLTLGEIPPAGLLDGKVNDTFTFTLLDQIDHDAPSAAAPSTEDTKFIDLSPTIQFTDADGDTISLAPDSFQIKVIDDTPIQRAGQTVKGTTEEEHNVGSGTPAMNHGNEDLTPDPADGDFNAIFNFHNITTNTVSGNLSSLVSVGNDEVAQSFLLGVPVAHHGNFALDSNVTGLIDQGLMSRGEAVTYVVTDTDNDGRGDFLTATAGGRPVFTLSLDNTGTDSGSYTFTLLDQLDHSGTGEDIKNIDFSSIIRFSDFDGDTIGLTAGSFSIDVIDDTPVFSGNPTGSSIDEEVLGGNVGEQGTGTGANADLSGTPSSTTGASLNISWGADDNKMGETATDTFGRKVNFARADGTLINDGATTAADLGLSTTLTSDGVGLAYQIVKTIGGAGVWDGGYQLIAYKVGGDFNALGDRVFTVTLDATANNGAYTFNILNNLDHTAPAAGTSTENNLDLTFRVRPTDADGDTTTDSRTFTVTVDDDAPSQTAPAGASIDEESLTGGNEGEQGTGTGPNADLPGALTTTSGAVSLNVSWGADSDRRADVAGDTFGRKVNFASTSNVLLDETSSLTGTLLGLGALTSDGVALSYRIVQTTTNGTWDGGYQLIAYKGGDHTIVANQVFTVTLDARSTNGSYTFNLLGNLDHTSGAGASENNLDLTLRVRATDADGDTAPVQAFTVVVDDDALAFGTIQSASIDEESVPGIGGNAGGGNGDLDPNPGTDVAGPAREVAGTFGILWGSDDGNSNVDGGFNGSVVNGDRSLTFAADAVSTLQLLGLKSDGVALDYTISANGTLLTATKTGGGATIFTISLSDQSTGSYTFKLFGNLDHAGETAPGTENDTVLTIKVTARDGDGDATNAQFTVTVDDDAPTVTAASIQNGSVDDEGLSGNAGEPSSPASYVGSDLAGTATTASGNLGVSWGADDSNSGTANRSLAFRDLVTNVAIVNGSTVLDSTGAVVKSHGLDVKYFVTEVAGVPTLIGYTGSDANVVANQVFKVTLDDTTSTGGYNFQLLKPLDHPAANTEDDRTLNFGFTAKDADGDSASGVFSVTVDDDSPIINAAAVQNGFVDEERLSGGNAGGDGSDLGAPQDDGDLTATGSLGISYGADGPADVVGSAPTNSTVNFDNVPQGPLPSPALTVGTYSFTSNQGIANHTGVAGQLYGTNVNVTNSAGPFTVSTLSLGLFGTSLTGDGQVRLSGTPAAGGAPIVVVLSGIVTTFLGSPISSFNLSSTALAGVQLSALKIEPVLPGPTLFNGSVIIDNIALGSGGGGISDGPVTFTDQSVASNNVSVTDQSGNPINLASLTSDGQPVLFKLLDALTLVAYTGSAPTSIDDANVVFSAVLNGAGSGSYTFVQKNNLDHPTETAPGTENDLVIKLNYTAKDFDGDKQDGSFTVTIDDDAPVATTTVLSGAVYENELSTATGDASTGTQAGNSDNKNATPNTDDTILTGVLTSLVSFGADNALATFVVETTNLSSSLTSLTSNGVPLTYTVSGNTLIAMAGSTEIFTFTVDANTGSYTFTLKGQLDHFGAGGTVGLGGTQVPLTSIDTIGEIATTGEVSGNSLAFEGRLPNGDVIIKVTNHSSSAVVWTLDNTDGGTDYPLTIAANTTIFINVGPISTPPNVQFELTGAGAPSGLTTVNSGHGILTVTGSGSGSDALVLDLSSAVTARDGDGDTVALNNQLLITVNDDAPVLAGTPADGAVNEAGLPNIINSLDVKPLLINFGADRAADHLSFARDANGDPLHPTGITSDDVALTYEVRTGGSGEEQLVAYRVDQTINEPVFIVELTSPPNPNYVFTLYQNLDHFGPNDTSLSLGFSIVATDRDGDSVTRNVTVNIADDVISVGAAPALGIVDEDARIASSGNIVTTTGNFTFDYGNDEADALTLNPSVLLAGVGGDGLLRSSGQLVSYAFIGATFVGYVGSLPGSATDGNVVFSVDLSTTGTGSYTFTLRQPLDHSGSPASTPITMTFSVTGSDGDGDTAPTSFAIQIDPAGSISSIDYSNLTSGVFVNLDDAATTVGAQTVAANTATDIATVTPKIVGVDNVAGVVDALGGSDNDILIGGSEANTLTGNAGNDTIEGRGGDDTMFGDAGNDTFVHNVGDGNDLIDGGGESGNAFPNYDVLVINGNNTAQTFNFGKFGPGNGEIVPTASGQDPTAQNDNDISITYAGGSVRADEIERVVFNLTAGDQIIFGDVTNTALAMSTVIVNSGGGNNTFDFTNFVGGQRIVINDSDVTGAGNGDTDLVKLAGKWTDWTVTQSGNEYTLTYNGATIVTTNIEEFFFAGNNATIPVTELVNVAPIAADDIDSVVEAGGLNNGTPGDNTATGNVLLGNGTSGNDTDGNTLDTETVVSVTFGTNTVNVPSNGDDATIEGTYGTLVIHADGTYTYTLNDADTDTNALPVNGSGTDVFSYVMQDDNGLQDTANLTINVTGANDNPVAQNDVITGGGGAIRVAVIGTNSSDVNGAVAQLNDDTYFDFTATGLTVSSYTTKAQWDAALAGYDVVVIGASGLSDDGTTNAQVYAALKDFADAGHGVVSTGWYSYQFTYFGSQAANADYITPIASTGGTYDFFNDQSFSVDSSHPITDGVTSITVGSGSTFWERARALDAGATVLAGSNSFPAIAYSTLAGGANLAYLGGIYLGNISNYNLTYLRTGNADRLLEQAVNWASNGGGVISEDATFTIQTSTLLANDGDVDTGDVLTVSAVSALSALGAVITLNGNGTISYDPTNAVDVQALGEGETATDTFTYTVSDGHGGTSTATVSLTVTGNNDAPVAVDNIYIVNEDGTLTIPAAFGVLSDDSDADGDVLSAVVVSQPQHGTLVLNADGSFTYTPDANYSGADSFSYRANDGTANSNIATVNLTINPVNDAPVANSSAGLATENQTLTVTAANGVIRDNDTDVDDAVNTLTIYGAAKNFGTITAGSNVGTAIVGDYGTFTLNADGSYTYVPDSRADAIPAGSAIVDGFSYIVQDPSGALSQQQSINITVQGVNDAPVITGLVGTSVAENAAGLLIDTFTVSDVDTATGLGFRVLGAGNVVDSRFEVVAASGTTFGEPGTYELRLKAGQSFDYEAESADANPTIALTVEVNDQQAANNIATVPVTVTVTDVVELLARNDLFIEGDGDPDAVLVSPGSTYVSFNNGSATGMFVTATSYTSSGASYDAAIGDFNGDGRLDFAVAGDSLNIFYSLGGGNLSQVITHSLPGGSAGIEVGDLNGDGYADIFVPTRTGSVGDHRVFLSTDDGPGGFPGYVPILSSILPTARDTIEAALGDIDGDGDLDAVVATLGGIPEVWINNGAGAFTQKAQAFPSQPWHDVELFDFDSDGDLDVLFSSLNGFIELFRNDGAGNFTSTAVWGSGTPGSAWDAAVGDLNGDGRADIYVTASGADLVLFNGTSVGGSPSFSGYSLSPGPQGYSAELADIDGDGDLDVGRGTVGGPFMVMANNGSGSFSVANASITGFGVALGDLEGKRLANVGHKLDVLGNDVGSGDPLTINSVTNSAQGATITVAPDGKSVVYNGANAAALTALTAGAFVDDTFTYTMTDGSGVSNSATVTVRVYGVNDAPVAVNDSYSLNEDQVLMIPAPGLLVNDTDVDGDSLTVTATNVAPAHGTLLQNANGSFSYTPDANYHGSDSFTYTVSDGKGGTSTATVNLTINPVNDAPDAVNDTLSFGGGSSTPPGGTSGWTEFNGHYYKLVEGNFTWDAARAAALAAGGYLVNITSAAENNFIVNTLNIGYSPDFGGYFYNISPYLWIGASDNASANIAASEGTWVWVDGPEAGQAFWQGQSGGAPVGGSYANWGIGEPNNWDGDEDYGMILTVFGTQWNDGTGEATAPGNTGEYTGYVIEYGGGGGNGGVSEDDVTTFSTSLLLANDTDPDGDSLTVTSVTGTGFSLAGTTITFDPTGNATLQALKAGESADVSFTYTISDGNGGTDTATATLKVNGVNDAATINGTSTGSTTEDGGLTASGTLSVSDVDTGEAKFQTPASLTGTYGTFTFNANTGAWGYTLNNAASNVQALITGQQVHDTLVVQSFDGTASRTIDVTINGANEPAAPLTVNDTSSQTGRYAFDDNHSPGQIAFDAATLFSGGTGAITYGYTLVHNTGSTSWITRTGNVFTGDPNNGQQGLYVYRVTATDSITSVSTYLAFNALPDDPVTINNDLPGTSTGSPGWLVAHSSGSGTQYGDLVTFNVANTILADAGNGHDVMIGHSGANNMSGGTGDDAVYGNGGNDTLAGSGGVDFIDGGAGNDTIAGGIGNDILVGGLGNDTFNYFVGEGADIVDGGSGTDTLAITQTSGNDTLAVIVSGGVVTSIGGAASSIANIEIVTANLGSGSDTLDYTGTTQGVTVNLGTGAATGFNSITSIENATGGAGNDTLIGSAGDNVLNGGDGNDTIRGGAGNDTIRGQGGIDLIDFSDAVAPIAFTLAAGGNGSATILGNDTYTSIEGMVGTSFADTLTGNSSDNVLVGGRGSDQLTGGGGSDTFRYLAGDVDVFDTILDFQSGSSGDIIDLSGLLASTTGNKADHVRFLYAGGSTHLASAGSAPPAIDGTVTVQAELTAGTWTDVARLVDTGANMNPGSDVIRMMLDQAQGVQQYQA